MYQLLVHVSEITVRDLTVIGFDKNICLQFYPCTDYTDILALTFPLNINHYDQILFHMI